MSRRAPNASAARSPRGRRNLPGFNTLGALVLTLAAGCTPLQLPPPDAPAARLPQAQGITAMTESQKQDLTRLNKRIYDEQEATIERERAQRAIEDALRSNAYFYDGWGGPGWYGPGPGGWYGPGGFGPGGYGGYGPRSSVGVGIGF
ncbi:hypothetical protein [Pandoraea terrigena]|uniref:Uncharacterized protein n=1 Tax=Pandoraea terrigena TaxID=2508292 RepID=A0A5E4TZI1_9BURK|nr:hypothetical protein [Pandoraea terrigena]VVD93336.1 hypothetical protein PTE31013_01753 [Pandoraea terrigena]